MASQNAKRNIAPGKPWLCQRCGAGFLTGTERDAHVEECWASDDQFDGRMAETVRETRIAAAIYQAETDAEWIKPSDIEGHIDSPPHVVSGAMQYLMDQGFFEECDGGHGNARYRISGSGGRA
ncbi:hypothetical protein [Natronorarus salvus]|uniref:hypothetical protein n=1 Tax=Natronorarus salvus TaxID=3117733 RepID=UPI002F263BF7